MRASRAHYDEAGLRDARSQARPASARKSCMSPESAHPGAAGSLREGLEETLTVMRLDLHENLERVLSSTA